MKHLRFVCSDSFSLFITIKLFCFFLFLHHLFIAKSIFSYIYTLLCSYINMQIVIAGQYKIIRKIGSGSFGQLYEAVSIKKGHKVAIKLQNCHAKYPQLLSEASILQQLQGNDLLTDKGVPNIFGSGVQGQYNYLIMDLLGQSIENLFQTCEGLFSLKTGLMVADQMLRRIQFVHSKGYLHRDIKPENFLMSTKKDRKIYLVDFGLSKKYLKNGKHFTYAQGKSLIGTVRYASLNNHYGIQSTRRDDLQSWFYCLIYFLKGELPWQNQKGLSKSEKYEKILGLKLEYRPQILCKGLPQQLTTIQSHIRSLKYDQKPNYQLIKQQLRNCMKAQAIQYDYNYDWQKMKDSMNQFDLKRSNTN